MDTTLFQDKHAAYQQLIARVRASYPAYHEATEYETGRIAMMALAEDSLLFSAKWV